MIGTPSPLRDELVVLTKRTLANSCLGLRPETDDLISLASKPQPDAHRRDQISLRDLARRWKALDAEIKNLDKQIEALVRAAAPGLVELHGVGVELAGQFLVTAGDNAERIHSEAAFAKLCGVAPPPPAADAQAAGTGSAAAATEPLTARSTSSPSSACATANPPATTSNAAPPKAWANEKSSAASRATSPARSTTTFHDPETVTVPLEGVQPAA